ncbi:MAG: DUF3231 family protein [Bacillota bacterium]
MDLIKKRLTSAEITNLWIHYIQETMAICVSKYALKCIEDTDISATFEFALNLSNNHIQILKGFFAQEEFPIPNGFTDEDVNLKAPPLFTETFWLEYIHGMTMHGSSLYSLAFNSSVRKDVRDFYYQCVNDSMNLYNKSIDVLISKEIYQKSPYYSTPQQVDYITKLTYVTDVFGKRRPLNSMESGNIYFNLKKSIITKAIILGFRQVCELTEIRKFMEKGLQVANKHIGLFSTVLLEDNLHSPKLMDSEVTNSSIAPFSDKLMLYHAGNLFSVAISYYGHAAVMSMRADLLIHCEAAISRDLRVFAKYGQIMIKNQWLEQPPKADDRKVNY